MTLGTHETLAREFDAAELAAIAAGGTAMSSRLIEIMLAEDLSSSEDDAEAFAPNCAVYLLGELRASVAIGPMLGLLAGCDADEYIYNDLVFALAKMGEPALEPVLAALAAATASAHGDALREILARLGVRDARILAALAEQLDEDLQLNASLLADHGDPDAVPLLSAAFDRLQPRREDACFDDEVLFEVAAAIAKLGGTLSSEQARKLAEAQRWRDELLQRARAAARAELGPAKAPVRPGRNELCWCGSGAKYKRCHLDSDAEGKSGPTDAQP